MPDPVNNETGNLGDGRHASITPNGQPGAGGTAQSTNFGAAHAPSQSDGSAGNSSNSPLHAHGGTNQQTGTGPEIDTGGATIPGINATGMPDWTETLEAINAIPEKIVNALREAEMTKLPQTGGAPMAGAEIPQGTDAPNHEHAATSASATVPGAGDTKVHWWYRNFGGK